MLKEDISATLEEPFRWQLISKVLYAAISTLSVEAFAEQISLTVLSDDTKYDEVEYWLRWE